MWPPWRSIAGTNTAAKTVAYFSAEFLLGPHLGNNLLNLGIEQARQAMQELGLDVEAFSMRRMSRAWATAASAASPPVSWTRWRPRIPPIGYGIRYEFGIFHQEILDGWQVEKTDKWLRFGNPWEIARPEMAVEVKFGGHTECYSDEQGRSARALDSRRTSSRAFPTTRRSSAIASTPPTPCGCGAPRPSSRSISRPSTSATTTAPSTRRSLGKHQQGAVPERRAHAGQGAAPRAAVFLRVLLAAGHAADPQDAAASRSSASRKVRRPAERHASRPSPSPN